jgi:hypothetical protein
VYSATLRVADDSGAASGAGVAVSIVNANPVAEAGADRTLDEGDTLGLVGTASDPGVGDVLSVAWDLDYDGINFDEDVSGTSTVDWSHGDGPASIVMAYRVRDDDYPYPPGGGGEVGETIDTLQVTVKNVPPTADAGPDRSPVDVGEPVTFNGNATDPGVDTFTFEWDYDFDGQHFDVDDTGQTVTTSYPAPDTYVVGLRVTDDDGGVGPVDTALVDVVSPPVTADARGPYNGYEGIPIELTGSGVPEPLIYTWDLDYDGTFETPGQVVTYTWPDNGVFTVTLRVEDGLGGEDRDDAFVTVQNITPTIISHGGPYTATVGIARTLEAMATDVPSDTLTYDWDLDDDGSFDDGTGSVVTYTWATTGIYTVTLRVNDGDGGIATDETTVNVNTLLPVAWLGASYLLARGRRAAPWKN